MLFDKVVKKNFKYHTYSVIVLQSVFGRNILEFFISISEVYGQ